MEPEVNTTEQKLSPNDASASLGFLTNILEQNNMEQMLAEQEEQPLEAPQTQESPQGEELELETEETPPIDPEALKKEIKAELLEELKNEFELTLKKKEE